VSPRFSILTPVHNPPVEVWDRCARSVQAQSHADWQWCIVDDGSKDPAVRRRLAELSAADDRIDVARLEDSAGISAASNRALSMAAGEYVVLLDHDDELDPDALARVDDLLVEPVDLVYTDEDIVSMDGSVVDPMIKPGWSPARLRSHNYVNHLSVLRTERVRQVGGFRAGFDGSQDHDLLLRVTEGAGAVYHLPSSLYRWRMAPRSVLTLGLSGKPEAWEAGRLSVQEHCDRLGVPATVGLLDVAGVASWYRLHYRFERRPSVGAVVSVTSDDVPGLGDRLELLLEGLAAWPAEVVVVTPGGEAGEAAAAQVPIGGAGARVRVRSAPHGAGPALTRMAGAVAVDAEVLLFLDAASVPTSADWLSELVGPVLEAGVGVVGARLLGPGGVIANAGYTVGPGGPGHLLAGLPADTTAYTGAALVPGERSAVSAAVLVVRREVFDAVGGFSTAYRQGLDDIDLCLKLREQGVRVLYTPLVDARVPAGWTTPVDPADVELLHRRWSHVESDPYVNPAVRASPWVTPCGREHQAGEILDPW